MWISIINHTNGKVSDEEVQTVLRAINRQIAEDFEPYWSMGAKLRLEGRSKDAPDQQNPSDMRGDAVIYLWDSFDDDDPLGYHSRNFMGIPYGFVFTELSAEIEEHWSVTLSHEALEMIADPEVNLLADGPHPDGSGRFVFHWYEMCDAVQTETYEIDHVEVSNFVLPLYFTGEEELGGRNDFLGRSHDGETLNSFGINPGGYVGFYDPELGDHDTYFRPDDEMAMQRFETKGKAKLARRSVRYRQNKVVGEIRRAIRDTVVNFPPFGKREFHFGLIPSAPALNNAGFGMAGDRGLPDWLGLLGLICKHLADNHGYPDVTSNALAIETQNVNLTKCRLAIEREISLAAFSS